MGKVLYFFIWKHLHVSILVIIFVGFRSDSAIGPELQSGLRCSKKNCNYLDLLLAKRCIHLDLSLPKVAKSCNHLGLSPSKSCNHLDLPLPVAKVALMLFCQKLFRFIASKSLKKVQLFWFVFSKTRKNLTICFKQLNLQPANIFFFGGEGENHLDLSQAKFAKNTISEVKIKNIAWNHIRDLSKQLVIKTVIWDYDLVQDFQFRFWYAIFDTNLVLWSEFNYKEIKIFVSIIFLNHKILFFHHDIFVIQWQSGRPEKFTYSYLFCVRRRSRTGAVDVNFCLTIMSKFLFYQTEPTVHI